MGDFLTGGSGAAQAPIIYAGIQVGTSQYDLPVQWLRGQRRVSTNLVWYNNFQKHKQSAKGKGGGKGGGQYTYTAAVILGLGFGVMDEILNCWAQGSTTTTTTLADLGFTFNSGTAVQTPWSFVVTNYPNQALAYANIANLVNPNLDLGSSASVPDMGFEARQIPYTDYLESPGWTNPTTNVNTPGRCVNMADFLPDFLLDPLVGGGFTSGDLPDLTAFREYQAAQGLFFSPYLSQQEKGTDIINRWAQIANTWIYWSNTAFVVVPLGDTALTANGYTYTPILDVDCSLGPDDFVSNPPVKVMVKDPADCASRTIVTITDRTMGYVTNPIEYKSQNLIRRFGAREPDNVQADEIANPAVGNIVAQLIGRRSAHLTKTYEFKTSWRFILYLPGSIFSLTDPSQGLDGEIVRITGVDEDEDGVLTWSAEELPAAIGTYHARNIQPGPAPQTPDQLIDPGNVNTPAVAEPAQVSGGTVTNVLIAASGGPNWGGANVWMSFDGTSYSNVGTIENPAIQGVLTANLATYGGANPDTGHTLSVNCAISQGEPEPVTNADADALRTLSLVCAPATVSGSDMILDSAGEMLAFGDDSATGTYTADLTYLQRGQLGTTAGAHSTDDLFTLFDTSGEGGSTIQFPLPAQYVGQPIWLKFASFNLFGKNTQDLSVCQSYKYTPSGAGFGGGSDGVPKAPTGLTTSAGVAQVALSWSANAASDNVTAYELYRAAGTGQSFGSASLLAVVAGLSYTDTSLPAATGYTYFLKAENAIGLSAATAGVNATTSSTALGNVTGPASAVDSDFVQFDTTTGKLIKDGGLARDTDGTLAANSDSKIPSQKAVKTYVDGKVAGLSWKQAVRAATTAAGTLSTAFANGQTIDGVTLATGDRILIKNQSTAADNGLYVVAASGAPARSTDADAGSELVNATCYVSEGTANADTQWTCTTNAPITVGSTALAFAQLSTGSGDVVGPGSATDLDFVQFDGTTGKLVKDGGLARDIDGTFAANSDSKIASQKAVKTYVDTALAGVAPITQPSIVQSAVQCSTSTYALTLGAAPTAGNLLVAFCTHWSSNLAAGAGWTLLNNTVGSVNDGTGIAYKLCGPGETTSQTPFSNTPTNNNNSAIFEITDFQRGSPIDYFFAVKEQTGTSLSQALGFYRANSLLIGMFGQNGSSTLPTLTNASSDGTATNATGSNGGPRGAVAWHNARTTAGTETPTATWAGSTVAALMAVLILGKR